MIYLNGVAVNNTTFPDNTSQVWKLPDSLLNSLSVRVGWEFRSESEFLQLAQLKTLLDYHYIKADLTINYLPYGRQDKPVSNTTTFALVTFAKLLNTLNFNTVTIIDPHSQVAMDLINNSIADYPYRKLMSTMRECGSDLVCYPDKGARTKYTKVYLTPQAYIYGEKVRNQTTGEITAYRVVGDCAGKNVMIVDDICDGGATFKLLAQELLASGAKEVNLFVTYGIFSKGVRTLFDSGINRVFTKDGEVNERSLNIQL